MPGDCILAGALSYIEFEPKEIALANHSKLDRADAQFGKLQRAEDAKKAMTEYEKDRIATQAKTERLRAQRIARDAADLAAGPKAPASATKKPARRKKGKSASLSEYLDSQDASGRQS